MFCSATSPTGSGFYDIFTLNNGPPSQPYRPGPPAAGGGSMTAGSLTADEPAGLLPLCTDQLLAGSTSSSSVIWPSHSGQHLSQPGALNHPAQPLPLPPVLQQQQQQRGQERQAEQLGTGGGCMDDDIRWLQGLFGEGDAEQGNASCPADLLLPPSNLFTHPAPPVLLPTLALPAPAAALSLHLPSHPGVPPMAHQHLACACRGSDTPPLSADGSQLLPATCSSLQEQLTAGPLESRQQQQQQQQQQQMLHLWQDQQARQHAQLQLAQQQAELAPGLGGSADARAASLPLIPQAASAGPACTAVTVDTSPAAPAATDSSGGCGEASSGACLLAKRRRGERYSDAELAVLQREDPARYRRILSTRKSVAAHRARVREARSLAKAEGAAREAPTQGGQGLEERLKQLERENREMRAQLLGRKRGGSAGGASPSPASSG